MRKAKEVLKQVFGYDEFRPAQEEVISAVSSGQDCLVVMPTGGGKSVCYQIPSILAEGTGIVISPLIALMQDQVTALNQLGVRAAFLNSTLSFQEVQEVEARYEKGELDLLYLAPERLSTERCIPFLKSGNPALFAIDEVHCVSQWGHDFRPDYLNLKILAEEFPGVPKIGLTATADEPTRQDIITNLKLDAPQKFITGFNRSNITYHVVLKKSPKQQLLKFIDAEHTGDCGIVYCLSRKKVEETAEWLCAEGRNALAYHAGLDSKLRARNQKKFLEQEGVIIVATVAFGMGIDKPNVRFVAHLDLPKSIEGYYQETGRAGRDGLAANAWMAYGLKDVVMLRQFVENSEADDQIKRIEHRKLNALLGYAETTECRRKVLLGYFGEAFEAPCGNCDVCIDGVETWDGTIAAQKALSCIIRTGQRFGTNYLIDVLRGSMNERIVRFGHDRIPTFGVGEDMSVPEWHSVFRQLVAAEYASVDIAGYGGLKLTESSKSILSGNQDVLLRKDTLKPAKKTGSQKKAKIVFETDVQQTLFESLRKLRTSLAKEQGVPPYVIFHDSTLKEMVVRHPQSLNEMSSVSGVGGKKLERYGQQFLNVLSS